MTTVRDLSVVDPERLLVKTDRENVLTAKVDALVEGLPSGTEDPLAHVDFAWCPECGMVFAISKGSRLPEHNACLRNPGQQTLALSHCSSCSRSYLTSDVHVCAGLYDPTATWKPDLPDHGPMLPVLLYDTEAAKALITAALHEVDCSPAICTCEDGAATFIAYIRGKA